jgi:NAD(P)-dependent dehydrogenase (short-subunit alcohol dehydrogenase family)
MLRRVAESIDPAAKRVAVVAGDVGDPQTSREMVAVAVRKFGGVDVLFNNAGIFHPTPFLETTPDELGQYLRLVSGYYYAAQAVIPEMRKRGGGAIVNTGSMWATNAIAATPCSASSTAKGGVHALTTNLAIEFAPDRIRVNAVLPAVVDTPLFDSILTPEQLAGFNAFHPLGRNGRAADVTEAVLFLADEFRSGWITGVLLPVDGGVTAGRN